MAATKYLFVLMNRSRVLKVYSEKAQDFLIYQEVVKLSKMLGAFRVYPRVQFSAMEVRLKILRVAD